MTLLTRLSRSVGPVGYKGAISATLNAVGSTLDLISFAVIARILSPENLGIFLIALAVGTIVERVGSPNLAQTFFRHTVRAVEKQRPGDLRRILDLAVLFELSLLVFGLASGLITAVIMVPSEDHVMFAAVVIAVMFTTLRPPLLAVAIAFAVWRVISAAGGLGITLTHGRRHGALSVKRSEPSAFAEQHADFWAFTRTGAIIVLPQAVVEFATMLIGTLSGVTVAGLYRLATKVGEAVRIYTNPISFALYESQCRSVERGDFNYLRSQTIRWALYLGTVTGLGALLFVVARAPLVEMAFGKGYDAAIPAITWTVVAAVPYSMSIPAQFGLFSLGAGNQVLRAETLAAVLFLIIVVALQTPSAEQAAMALAARAISDQVASYPAAAK